VVRGPARDLGLILSDSDGYPTGKVGINREDLLDGIVTVKLGLGFHKAGAYIPTILEVAKCK
jgi:hypothetical protein